MSKLLSADFKRMWKNKFFLIGMTFMFVIGVFMPVMNYISNQQDRYGLRLDDGFFSCVVFIGFILAVLCSLFIGTDYSDGTIRNKITTGQNRTAIYLSNLITCTVSGAVMCMLYFVTFLCVGIPLLGFFKTEIKTIALFVLGVFMLTICFSAIFTSIAMLNQNKTITAIVCILGIVMLLAAGVYIHAQLNKSETLSGYTITADSDTALMEGPNPEYVGGTKRQIYQFIDDFLPGGQMVQMCMSASIPWYLPLYSCIIAVAATGIGIAIFKKKDLK
ncbi:MAG: ABC transporter permease subunit [Oscillospiraceae bacterium]